MIKFSAHSGLYTLESEQFIPIQLDDCWEFFSSPKNLVKMTPKHMKFRITSGIPAAMYPGQIITYKVNVLPGIPSNWVTEITHVKNKSFFVDEQRFGPYTMWHHEHHFTAHENGVIMKDKITYKLPLGLLGRLVHPLLVKPQLKKIFEYRRTTLEQLFSV